jgi:hypothetical protein
MEESSITPDFTKEYIVFAHGSRLVSEGESSFRLGPNYRLVTLHQPDKKIKDNLTRIILGQIDSKISLINNLFSIGCPIARQSVRENLEKCFIVDWLVQRHQDPISNDKLVKDLVSIGDLNAYDQEITTNAQLRAYVNTLDFARIKSYLGFEIRTYRPNEYAPKLLLEFKFNKSLTNVKSGIFNPKAFKDFDFDKTDELNLISSISSSVEPSSVKSLIKFNNAYSYVFDPSDIVCPTDKLFFNTINSKIKTGLIVVLSCGTYDGEPMTKKLRSCSVERQRAPYNKKYIINYDL